MEFNLNWFAEQISGLKNSLQEAYPNSLLCTCKQQSHPLSFGPDFFICFSLSHNKSPSIIKAISPPSPSQQSHPPTPSTFCSVLLDGSLKKGGVVYADDLSALKSGQMYKYVNWGRNGNIWFSSLLPSQPQSAPICDLNRWRVLTWGEKHESESRGYYHDLHTNARVCASLTIDWTWGTYMRWKSLNTQGKECSWSSSTIYSSPPPPPPIHKSTSFCSIFFSL